MNADNKIIKYILMGAGGHASVLLDIIKINKLNIVGVCDPLLIKENIKEWHELPVLGDDEYLKDLSNNEYQVINGLGSMPGNNLRSDLQKVIDQKGFNCPSLIHPFTSVSKRADLSKKGLQIMAGAIIQSRSKIMDNVILNSNTSVDHDCIIHKNVSISPGVVICGNVEIEENVFIGCGTKIVNNVKIGRNSTIGAGSLILNDVAEGSKVIQKNEYK